MYSLFIFAATRGSISGFWSLCGSAGILSGTGFGSLLFDVLPGGPFLLFGAFNCVLCIYACVLYVYERRRTAAAVSTVAATVVDEAAQERARLIQ